jgi:uncharacterized protein
VAGTQDPQGERLPIKLDTASNGEYAPLPLTPPIRRAKAIAHEWASRWSQKLGISRRSFLTSTCGAAATLLAIDRAFAEEGQPAGGTYAIDPEAVADEALATSILGGKEFIFDVQTHHVDPKGPWRSPLARWNVMLRAMPQALCDGGLLASVFGSVECFSAQHFIKEIFLDSDTDIAVLSFVPATDEDEPLTLAAADETRKIVDAMEGTHRLLLHGRVNPNVPGEIERMPEIAERWKISAWKTYTQFAPPGGTGYWLSDEKVAFPFFEAARKSGIKVICIHKGLPLPGLDPRYASARDVGAAAKAFPDLTFIIYHSGYEPGRPEGPYTRSVDGLGVDAFVQSLEENGIVPGSNVYAELGSTWRMLMRDPNSAAHTLGKLLKSVGEDRILWGTDSIWYGSPQDQIQAFRAFQISPELRDANGYREITPEIRAKIFGLNAAVPYRLDAAEIQRCASNDRFGRTRDTYLGEADPSFRTYGPRTRREWLSMLSMLGGPA